jgi:hypothetical protein
MNETIYRYRLTLKKLLESLKQHIQEEERSDPDVIKG